ncbi:MAG: 8-amino-7-oxononanoate synthase [Gammaproteobacteria bacterium]|nr:8-amino-7-oxononanoate synthase [Gammaproteobacteria bacterium]MCW5583115.1 8-amino-7-oxononanoate synthase [Gammaproteobacteria bacterium]
MPNSITPHLISLLNKQNKCHQYRTRYLIKKQRDCKISIAGKSLINFCSNDYLNLSTHPDIKNALIHSATKHGLGSTASALVSGYSQSHRLLEEQFAKFLRRDKALLFNSGYHANLGVITTFANRNSAIIADKHCHASLHDGALLSRAKFYRYHHSDLEHAELLLKSHKHHKLLVTESIFSMHGNISNILAISKLTTKYNTMLIVDDAHGIGVLGDNGAGVSNYFKLSQKDIPCLITPLGKALGSFGAIVSGEAKTIEALLQFARTYRYSTALPPAICDATLAALNLLKSETWRNARLHYLCDFFNQEASSRALTLLSLDKTPIKSFVIGSNKNALDIQQKLMNKGLFVSCIRPPTVPINSARIRISLNCMHSEQQIIYLLDQFKKLYEKNKKK